MNTIVLKALQISLMAAILLATPLLAQVYKTVDEDGNVTFTDKAPSSDAKPIDLAPLSIIEAPTYAAPKTEEELLAEDAEKEMSVKYLRKNFSDFAMVAPQPDETIWGPESVVTVAWNTGYQLQEGMLVYIILDGQLHSTTTDQITALPSMDRGEHTVKLELRNAKRQTIASDGPISFFLRRPGVLNRARPGGG